MILNSVESTGDLAQCLAVISSGANFLFLFEILSQWKIVTFAYLYSIMCLDFPKYLRSFRRNRRKFERKRTNDYNLLGVAGDVPKWTHLFYKLDSKRYHGRCMFLFILWIETFICCSKYWLCMPCVFFLVQILCLCHRCGFEGGFFCNEGGIKIQSRLNFSQTEIIVYFR